MISVKRIARSASFFWSLWIISIAVLPLLLPIARNLEYEYFLIVALLAALISPWLGLSRFKPGSLSQASIFFLLPALLLSVPGLLYLTATCGCSWQELLIWYFLQAYPAWLLGIGLAGLVQYASSGKIGKKQTLLLLVLAQVTIIVVAIMILWLFPQKRMSHFLLGYLHGPIYDRWLPIGSSLVWSRLTHSFFAVGLILFSRKILRDHKTSRSLLLALGISILPMAGNWFIPSLGHGHWALQRLLPDQMSSEHFTLHFKAQPTNSRYHEVIHSLFAESRFHVDELRAILGDDADHVDIYVYPDQNLKKIWFGGGSTDIADVVSPSIHIVATQGPHPTLRHELVHALSAHFAFFGLGFHPNMMLTEGLAVALAPNRRSRSLDEATAAMIHQNRLPAFEQLSSPFFWTESGPRAYTAAGSLIQYLIRQYGIEPVKELYAGRAISSLQDKSWPDLLQNWQSDLLMRYPSRQDFASEALYRHPGVLQERCPHTKASFQQVDTHSLRQPFGWQVTQDYWPWRRRLEPSDREVLVMDLQSTARQAVRAHDFMLIDQVLVSIDKELRWPPRSIEDLELRVLATDLSLFLGRPEASDWLEELRPLARESLAGPHLSRQIWARILVQEQVHDWDLQRLWLQYLAGWQALPASPGANAPWIIHYLRNFRGQGIPAQTLLEMSFPSDLPVKLPQSFFEMWYLNIAYRLLSDKRYDLAQRAFELSLTYSLEGGREKTEELIRWMQTLQVNNL